MLSPDAAFQSAANAAAAAFASRPPYLRYRVSLAIARVRGTTASESVVVLRTADGVASVRDATGALRTGAPPALPIALDALAEWGFRLEDTGEDARLGVAYERPHAYASAAVPGSDVTVTSVRGYSVSYAPGASDRIVLEPVTPEMRAYASGTDDFVYREVTFDPATMLPVRVVLAAPGETLTLEYAITHGQWLLARAVDDDRTRTRSTSAIRRLEARYSDVTAATSASALDAVTETEPEPAADRRAARSPMREPVATRSPSD